MLEEDKLPEEALLAKLLALGSSTVYEAQGQVGAAPPAIRPIPGGTPVIGRAYTLRISPGDNLGLHHAVVRAQPGDCLLVDASGFLEAGVWGEVLTVAAQARGLAGLVVDGAVRDVERVAALGFPVFSRGISMGGATKTDPGVHGLSLVWDGTTIEPGDLVVGDQDGVCVVKHFELDTVLAAAISREEREAQMLDALHAGASTLELLGLPSPNAGF